MRNITEIVIHCSATPEGREVTVKEIDRWHRERGFAKIGYHYVIHLDGSVSVGRKEEEAGAHVSGHNANSIGVCYVGGVDANNVNAARDTRTPAQKVAMEKLVKELVAKYPKARVLGHRDFPGVAKACPCFDAIKWWADVKAGKAPAAPAPKAPANTHTVVKGDTLSKVAKKYGVDLFKLADVNGRVDTTLSIGETLKLPV